MPRFSTQLVERMRRSPAWGDGRFHNRLPSPVMMLPSPDVLKKFMFEGGKRTPPGPLPSVPVKREVLAGPAHDGLRATWLGHSTTLVEMAGKRVLIDPVWSERASPADFMGPKRFQPVPIALEAIPMPDVVLVSHDHYDHLDSDTIVSLGQRGAKIVTGLGVGARFEAWGVPASQITQLDWWQEHTIAPGFTVRAMPARHFSGRGPLDRDKTLWASWCFENAGIKVYFGGDGGFDEEGFREIGERAGPFDLTMLEIGAFDEAWSAIHLGPVNAVKAHQLLRGKTLLPVHWGTFDLALHAWDAPAEELLTAIQNTDVQVALPRIGESVLAENYRPNHAWWRELSKRTG